MNRRMGTSFPLSISDHPVEVLTTMENIFLTYGLSDKKEYPFFLTFNFLILGKKLQVTKVS